MGTFWLLATEAGAHASHGGGVGLNFDILETNLINLAIIIGVLFYFGRQFLGKILSERRSRIETAIQEAEGRKKEAAAALADAQQKLAEAQAEAARIRSEAQERAKAAKEAILAQAAADVERLKADSARDLDSERERAIAELRQRVAAMAIEKVESQLSSMLDQSAQEKLVDRSIAMLGGGA